MGIDSIAFLGAGNMAEAFCRGLIQGRVVDRERIFLSDLRPAGQIAWAAEAGLKVAASNLEAVDRASVVVLSVKPKDVDGVLDGLAAASPEESLESKTFLSIAAGVPLARLEAGLKGRRVPVVRVMPNTPALVGRGASAFCLGTHAGGEQAGAARAVLQAVGIAFEVKEAQMDAVTALSGSGPAYVFLFMEALQAAGEKLGLEAETCFQLAAQTLAGASEMIQRRTDSPARLREKVTSPGGTTAAALKAFEEGGFKPLVEKALRAARDRGVELGKS